ncbi:MAG: hypothetical protein HC913_23810 [Microscillaceae bacterium]|nr:hypothetical protein [Microscillaceae bacterium]
MGLLAVSERPEVRDKTPADGKVCGYARIEGRTIGLTADDVTVMAGAGGYVGYHKENEVHQYALQKGYPIVHLGDAGGVRIPDAMGAVGNMRILFDARSAPRHRFVPALTAIMGECYGGPTWQASVSDIVVQVKGAHMAVVGPSILEAANNDATQTHELGSWEMHAYQTGAVDLFAENDAEALHLLRKALSYLPDNAEQLPPQAENRPPSRFKQNALLDIFPPDSRYAYDMHQVLDCIVDQDSLLELKPFYDGSLITALARLEGQVVGILANNPKVNAGGMGAGACEKAVSFIVLCDSFHIPLIFLHDTPGFYTSVRAEEQRIPVKIMNWVNAYQYCTVPRISVYLRRSYGAASHLMMGANMGGDFVLAWPTADISFTAPEVALNVVLGRKLKEAPDPEAMRRDFLEQLAKMNAPWEAAGLGYIDKIIDPRHTRPELIRALEISKGHKGGRSERRLAAWNKM